MLKKINFMFSDYENEENPHDWWEFKEYVVRRNNHKYKVEERYSKGYFDISIYEGNRLKASIFQYGDIVVAKIAKNQGITRWLHHIYSPEWVDKVVFFNHRERIHKAIRFSKQK